MSQHFNSDVRDALRDSNSIDPTPWLTAEKSKSDMEPIWLKQLATHIKLDPYREIATVTKITVRYFQPAKVEAGDPQQENAVTEEQNFNKMLDRREKFCGEFEIGSDARNNCFKIFACFENGKFCDNAADGIMSFFNPSDFSTVP
jgi:hypothetical protein